MAGDRRLTLTWAPVREDIEGGALQELPMYQVYRKRGNEKYTALGEPVRKPEFTDTGLQNDTRYSYRVQTIVADDDSLYKSGFSREQSGRPVDLQAPERPESLIAVAIPAGVKLVWQAVIDDDLAGYRIYRRGEGDLKAELIGEVAPDRNQYVDPGETSGKKRFYSVTAFDSRQPPNESQPSKEAAVNF